ncbi:MAG TPA: nucleotide-binding protein [Pyrinomonadaceae bacterium]
MARIHPKLVGALRQKLRVSKQRVYQLIAAKARDEILPRHLAAIAVAAEAGLNISKFASSDELKDLRSGRQSGGASQQSSSAIQVRLPGKLRARSRKRSKPSKRRGTSVFVVHGRNEKLRRSLFGFLRSVGLQPIEWRRAIELTHKPNPYVGEILDAAFREAAAVVVLLSPDDEAKLKTEFIKTNDPVHEKKLTGQARPNVLFEAGMAMGRNPDSTVLVQVGEIRPFSDIGGRHVVHLSNAAPTRSEFATKLANAGCNVNTSGSDWLTEGDFDLD